MKRALGAGLVAVASASLVLSVTAPVAQAAQTDQIAAAGSDTTQDVMGSILAADGVAGKTTNIKAGNFQNTTVTVGADGFCLAHNYKNKSTGGAWPSGTTTSPELIPAPDGSGEGRTALNNSRTAALPYNNLGLGGGIEAAPNGCIDIARSSGGRRGTDPTTNQYYAFAIDAVTWGSSSLNAPAALTQSQLQGIFNCTYTDWSQVGGQPGPIQRVLPQAGSGTLSFFLTNLLGVAADTDVTSITTSTCPAVIRQQENQWYDMYHGSSVYGFPGSAAQYPNAIGPYSAGKFAYQAGKDTNPTIDLRAGFRPGALTVPQGTVTGNVYALTWNGAWALNNASVVGDPTVSARSENITTTAGSTTVTLVPTTHVVTNVATTNGSFTVTAPAGTFTQEDVNSPITVATGIPGSTLIASVSPTGNSATITKAATANGTTSMTLASHFNASDAGATLSGNGNIAGGTTIAAILSTTQALLSAPATTAGTGVATTITPLGQVHNVTVNSSTLGNATLNAAAGTFNSSDVGKVIDSPCTFGNTKIAAVSGPGDTATITPGASKTCSAPFAAKIGFTAVSAGNSLAAVGAQAPWPGARFVYNVIDSTTPSYLQARDLVGYNDVAGGAKSPLCSSAHDDSNGGADSIIFDNGFLPVEPHTSAGGNTNVSCYKF